MEKISFPVQHSTEVSGIEPCLIESDSDKERLQSLAQKVLITADTIRHARRSTDLAEGMRNESNGRYAGKYSVLLNNARTLISLGIPCDDLLSQTIQIYKDISKASKTTPLFEGMVKALSAVGQFDKAVELNSEIGEKGGSNYFWIVRGFVDNGELEKAREFISRLKYPKQRQEQTENVLACLESRKQFDDLVKYVDLLPREERRGKIEWCYVEAMVKSHKLSIREAVSEAERVSDNWYRCVSLRELGYAAARMGDFELAEEIVENPHIEHQAGHVKGVIAEELAKRGMYDEAIQKVMPSIDTVTSIIHAQLKSGELDTARKFLDKASHEFAQHENKKRWEVFMPSIATYIAEAFGKSGHPDSGFFEQVESYFLNENQLDRRDESLERLALAEARTGLFERAEGQIAKIENLNTRATALSSLAVIKSEQGIDAQATFDQAEQIVSELKEHNGSLVSSIAKNQARAGFFEMAEKNLSKAQYFFSVSEGIVKKQIEIGDFEAARKSATYPPLLREYPGTSMKLFFEAISTESGEDLSLFRERVKDLPGYFPELSDEDGAKIWSEISEQEGKFGINKNSLSRSDVEALLLSGRDDVANAIGVLMPEVASGLEIKMSEPTKIALQLGAAEEQGTLSKMPLSEQEDERSSELRAISRAYSFYQYETASNALLGILQSSQSDKDSIRVLKTLIEQENPKGRYLATQLFTEPSLARDHKRYLAEKLIAENHWDAGLGAYLIDKDENEVSDTLTAIIRDLGLTPDMQVYQVVEKPGLLHGNTLVERIEELQNYRSVFSGLSRGELLDKFKKEENLEKIFYLLYGGEYRYSLINDYSFEKFKSVTEKIHNLEEDPDSMARFENILRSVGMKEEDASSLVLSLQQGVPPVPENERTTVFTTNVEFGSKKEALLQRLGDVWGQELPAIYLSELTKSKPENMQEALELIDGIDVSALLSQGQKTNKRVRQILETLRTEDKQDYETITKLAETLQKDLLSRARQQKDKSIIAEIKSLNPTEIVLRYVRETVKNGGTFLVREWESHFKEIIEGLSEVGVDNSIETRESMELELTFLDKGKDFVRSVRFADAFRCCFNSTRHIPGERSAADYIAMLNKDPLSFIMDIKKKGSKEISGFVFGRMGVNSQSNEPILMLNGIYSAYRGNQMVNNVLKIVEEKLATRLKVSSVVIAAKHGGSIESPEGYQKVSERKIEAIRGIKQKRCYDDIGTAGSEEFAFSGYEKFLK